MGYVKLGFVFLVLGVARPATATAASSDTARLIAELRAVKGKRWLSSADYSRLQRTYLAWIDTRIRSGRAIDSMNEELRASHLFPEHPTSNEPDVGNYVGFLEDITTRRLKHSDIVAVVATIYKGPSCALDETIALYASQPPMTVAHISADLGAYAFHVSGLDAQADRGSGDLIIASGWTISNCTSTWNGKRIRVDRVQAGSVQSLLTRDLSAQDRDDPEDDVAATIEDSVVTFRYQGGISDGDLLSVPSIAVYRVLADRAIRTTPLALSRAGFIHEWIELDTSLAAGWSEAVAAQAHGAVAREFHSRDFKWAHIAKCGGIPELWEIGTRIGGSNRLHVFGISGSNATELRMVAVNDKVDPSCKTVAEHDLQGVAGELPW